VVAALLVGVLAPSAVGRAGAQAAPSPVADASAQIDQVAAELAGLDSQVAQLRAALAQADDQLAKATATVEEIRQEATSREQLEAQLTGQARAYAIQRYMYGSTDSRDLLAFLAALNKPADDAVWGLATLEVSSKAALDQAAQVAKARAAVADRLAQAESDVVLLTTARARRAQDLDATSAQRTEVATRFEGVVRELGQATVNGMSTVAYDAYLRAQATLAAEQPACGLRWELLAAIGKTESNHGVGRLDVFGNSMVPIIGIPIGGDTDGGALDGDSGRDHAVGPMQFIPSTWRKWGTDANGDGKADPGNIIDAATAAGRYLCRAAGDLTLTTEAGVIRAILSYNPNQTYLRVVGARFESLASDLALGWFSAAALPPAPAPLPDVPPNAGPDGRDTAGNGPTTPPPPTTTLTAVRVFGPQDLTSSTTAPITIPPGECRGPSLALDGRGGFLRCGPTGGALLDPCEVAPYDATLVGCLPDPTGTPVLLRLANPAPTVSLGAPPPYRLLVLDGGDRCLPIPATEPAPSPSPVPTTTTTTTTTLGGPSSTGAPSSSTGPPSSLSTTTSTSAPHPGRGTTTTTAAPASATAAASPSTDPPATTGAARPAGPAAAKAAITTTSPPSPSTAPTTTVPIAQRPTYACASGATVIGLPDTTTTTWLALVRQPGLADRQLPVIQAYG
jgi:membrane-bound lytic murein transglycosylase B